jgi:O-antigen/teichoic acid export membrane protein
MEIRQIYKNTLYVLGAQFLILVISITRSLILPAFFSIESYGYWQIYLFYSAYVGIFAFGFNDGIYLRYGDKEYNELPFEKLRTSIRIFSAMSFFITIITTVAIILFTSNNNLRFSLLFAACNIFILGLTGVFTYILQITNQLKKYSFFSVADKVLVLITVALMFFINNNNHKLIIAIDFFAKALVLAAMIYLCKELWIGKNTNLKIAYKEFEKNINVGIKLLIANLMGMLIIGIGRFLIQVYGNIEDFATYSFGITITGLVLTAITAFSLVLYPTIKRLDKTNYDKYFKYINSFIIAFNFIVLLLYFPAYWGVTIFYSKYTDMLPYLNLLFIVTILQGKMSILNNTFYKVLRKEKAMLTANLSSVLLFAIIAPILFYYTRTIWSIAFSTFLTMLFRCYTSEIYLKKLINIQFDYKIIVEIAFILFFIITTTFMGIKYSSALYFFLLTIWIIINVNELTTTFKTLKIKV